MPRKYSMKYENFNTLANSPERRLNEVSSSQSAMTRHGHWCPRYQFPSLPFDWSCQVNSSENSIKFFYMFTQLADPFIFSFLSLYYKKNSNEEGLSRKRNDTALSLCLIIKNLIDEWSTNFFFVYVIGSKSFLCDLSVSFEDEITILSNQILLKKSWRL